MGKPRCLTAVGAQVQPVRQSQVRGLGRFREAQVVLRVRVDHGPDHTRHLPRQVRDSFQPPIAKTIKSLEAKVQLDAKSRPKRVPNTAVLIKIQILRLRKNPEQKLLDLLVVKRPPRKRLMLRKRKMPKKVRFLPNFWPIENVKNC